MTDRTESPTPVRLSFPAVDAKALLSGVNPHPFSNLVKLRAQPTNAVSWFDVFRRCA